MQKDSYLPVITHGAGNYLLVKRGTTRFFENCFLSFIKKFPKKRRGSSWLLPLPYVSYLLLRTLPPPFVHYAEIRGVLVSANFWFFLVICQCQGLDMFRGKKNKDCHFLSTVCFSLSQFVRGNNDNGYNRILAVLERHWGLNKGSPQK